MILGRAGFLAKSPLLVFGDLCLKGGQIRRPGAIASRFRLNGI